MTATRKVALRVNGTQVTRATLRRGEKQLELVVLDPFIGEFVICESFTAELLELVHSREIRSRRWALAKELELGVLKITPLQGIRVTRHFTLISRSSPEPQGLADAFRAFTLRRVAHISKIRKKTNPTT